MSRRLLHPRLADRSYWPSPGGRRQRSANSSPPLQARHWHRSQQADRPGRSRPLWAAAEDCPGPAGGRPGRLYGGRAGPEAGGPAVQRSQSQGLAAGARRGDGGEDDENDDDDMIGNHRKGSD